MRSRNWANGVRSNALEKAIAKRMGGVDPACVVATRSGTAALAVSAEVTNLYQPWTVCPLTWPATYSHQDPDTLYWTDCDSQGWPVEPVNTGVELWGRPWPFSYAPDVLDAAHNFAHEQHAALLSGGTTAVCYSFGPQKQLACWEGGAAVFSKVENAHRARRILHCGTELRMFTGEQGSNGLMTDVAAAFLLEQIKDLPRLQARRQAVLEEYDRHIDNIYTLPGIASGHLCVINCGSEKIRRMYSASLAKTPSIQCGHHYALNIDQRATCPKAAELSDKILTLPCHAEMTAYDVRRVVNRLLRI